MRPMTRRERRAERQRQYLIKRTVPPACPGYRASAETGPIRPWDGEMPLPGWLRPLDYKVSSESGALKVHSEVRTWHLGGRANGHKPPPGQGWERSGPTYLVAGGRERLVRLRAEQTAANKDT